MGNNKSRIKDIIRYMEMQCDSLAANSGCEKVNCRNCDLNKKYKKLVGIGLDENVEVPKFIS